MTDGHHETEPADGADVDKRASTHVESDTVNPDFDFEVPADSRVAECSYCGRPFLDEDLLALHRGFAHGDALSEAHREAFEAAYEEEQSDLRRYQLKSAGLVVLLYFGFLMLYAFV